MTFHYFGQTDVGRKRDKNEDSLLISDRLGLFMVADGMGGHQGGEFASRMAVKIVEESITQFMDDPEATLPVGLEFDRTDPGQQIGHAFRLASQRIFEEASRNPSLRGMGTTAVALLIRNDKGFVANVGDSRSYLVRNKTITQITQDHSLVAEQLRAAFITEQELKHHKYKNIITRSVGFQSDVEIDIRPQDLQAGDRYVLCSDGLTNLVVDTDILKIVSKNDPKDACRKLIELANKKGGDDNVSVIVVAVDA